MTLGGRHLGSIALLEDRARVPTYQAMFRTLIDTIAPEPGEAILDVGCGAGSLDRLLAQRLSGANRITAIDMNPFYLKEAEALAAEDGLVGGVRFVPGSAEALPFPDAAFGAIFSVTVLEELRRRSRDLRNGAGRHARWARWYHRPLPRSAAMVEPRPARADPP